MATAGARLRTAGMAYYVNARGKKYRPDTTVVLTPGLLGSTFVFTPAPRRAPGTLVIGGVPAWRSFLTFNTALPSRTFACPPAIGTCTFRLQDVTVDAAGRIMPLNGGSGPAAPARPVANNPAPRRKRRPAAGKAARRKAAAKRKRARR